MSINIKILTNNTKSVDNTFCVVYYYKQRTRIVRLGGDNKLNREKIAQTLINLRGDRSREEVAKSIGISVSALQMYENGQRVPKDEIKIKIAQYYGVSVETIFFS